MTHRPLPGRVANRPLPTLANPPAVRRTTFRACGRICRPRRKPRWLKSPPRCCGGCKREARKLLHGREVCEFQLHLDAAMIPARDLTLARQYQRLTRRQVRARRLVEQVVELVADAGELRSHQHGLEPIDGASVLYAHHQKLPPIAAPYSAKGRNNEGSGEGAALSVSRLPVGRPRHCDRQPRRGGRNR